MTLSLSITIKDGTSSITTSSIAKDATIILIMSFLTMTILISLYAGGIAYNDITNK